MLPALRSLTVRGRSFLAAGITAVVCGLVLLERDLVRIGVLVAALPLIAAAYVATRSHHLRLRHDVSAASVRPDETVTVQVRVENGGAPTGVLLMEEEVPAALGSPPRFVVPPMGRDDRELLEYTVTPRRRGRYTLGPVQVRQREPFGMVERRERVPGAAELLVLPRVVPLPTLRLGGSWFTAGEESPRSFSVGTVADVIVREYRRGDDLRRVHWRSTARTGELMVRNEEQLWQARSIVLLDNRSVAHRGVGEGSSFEAAVVAAASATVHLAQQGYHVRLVTASGRIDSSHEPGRGQDPFPVLQHLATISTVAEERLPEIAMDDETAGGVTVALVGAAPTLERSWWARFPRLSAVSLALAFDVDSWGQRPTAAPVSTDAAWLTAQGWRTGTVAHGDPLAERWQELDR